MNQLCMTFDAPRARRTDPETSQRAAVRSLSFSGGHKARILAALKQHGPMSPKRIFDFTGLSVEQCDRRRKEMIGEGLIRIQRDAAGNVVEDRGCEVWEAV
jgi:hypothetical protein